MRIFVTLLITAVALAFACIVWPTRYRYDRTSLGPNISVPVRMDRFTGRTEVFNPLTKTWRGAD